MISTTCIATHVEINIDDRCVRLDHPHAVLLAGRLQTRSDITIVGDGGSLIYRTPFLGADTLAIADNFLSHAAARIELDSLTRNRLVKVLQTL